MMKYGINNIKKIFAFVNIMCYIKRLDRVLKL